VQCICSFYLFAICNPLGRDKTISFIDVLTFKLAEALKKMFLKPFGQDFVNHLKEVS
jgi:hypothetical protein